MLLEIKGDLVCHSDTLRTTSVNGYRSDIVLFSMFGPRNAVRAAWAKLSAASRRGNDYITVGGSTVSKAAGATYTTVNAHLGQGMMHCVMFHQQLGHNAPDRGFIYQEGADASRRYFGRLSRWCAVPFRASWCEPLWNLGRAHNAIVEVAGHGREVWSVSTKRETWEPIVQAALVAGDLR